MQASPVASGVLKILLGLSHGGASPVVRAGLGGALAEQSNGAAQESGVGWVASEKPLHHLEGSVRP